jgi:predicted nucleic acid-binding protein
VDGYLFDASALSAYLNEDHTYHASASAKIDALPLDSLKLVSIITLAEIDYGIRSAELAGSPRLVEYRQRLEVIKRYAPLELTSHTGENYAELKACVASHMRQRPKKKFPRWIEDWIDLNSAKRLQIDENDLWICAQAKERDLILVTGDADIRRLCSYDPSLRIILTRD